MCISLCRGGSRQLLGEVGALLTVEQLTRAACSPAVGCRPNISISLLVLSLPAGRNRQTQATSYDFVQENEVLGKGFKSGVLGQ